MTDITPIVEALEGIEFALRVISIGVVALFGIAVVK